MNKNRPLGADKSASLAANARALAVVLPEEFGIPFVLYEAAGGVLVVKSEIPDRHKGAAGSNFGIRLSDFDYPDDLAPEAIARLAAEGRGSVTLLTDGRFQLAIVLFDAGQPVLIGVGVINALTGG